MDTMPADHRLWLEVCEMPLAPGQSGFPLSTPPVTRISHTLSTAVADRDLRSVRDRRAVAAVLAVLALLIPSASGSTLYAAETPVIARAVQNLKADPRGRVVDVTLSHPVDLQLPDDNPRFEIDLTRPLGRDVSFCVADLDGNGLADLFGGSFSGSVFFYPALDANPYRFGAGQLVRRTEALGGIPYLFETQAAWSGCTIADLDGDGGPEVVIGADIYTFPEPGNPTLVSHAGRLYPPGPRFILDPFPSAGDLDGDGKPDVVLTSGLPRSASLFRNQSTPGNFIFQEELLTENHNPGFLGERGLVLGDLNGDSLLDMLSNRGIFFNRGSAENPQFDFSNPFEYQVLDGPWVDGVTSDQGIGLALHDGDGDGLLDVYVSSLGTSVWQGVYYRNTGTPSEPMFQFQEPILCLSTPYNQFYRGHNDTNISGTSLYPLAADVNRDGLPDILISEGRTVFNTSTVLWNRAADPDQPHFAHLDIYTFFTGNGFPILNPYFGFQNPNWQPDILYAWEDFSGDGQADAIQADIAALRYFLSFRPRRSDFPVRFDPPEALQTTSGAPLGGLGWARLDWDNDGIRDLILGVPSNFEIPEGLQGQLRVFRGIDAEDALRVSDPVPLTDPGGVPIDIGENAFPVAFDWDRDGQSDLLAGEHSGRIQILLKRPGGFVPSGWLAAEGWDPIDLVALAGGGVLSPRLSVSDLNLDGMPDVVAGESQFNSLWYLKNLGGMESPQFSAEVLSVDRTIPGRVEKLRESTFRLYFSIPVIAGETRLFFYPARDENQAHEQVVEIEEEPFSLYLPYFRSESGSFTGFAASNPTADPAHLSFSAYGEQGELADFPRNPSLVDLIPRTQSARLTEEIFGLPQPSGQLGWIRLNSDNLGIGSFFQFGDSELNRLDGSVALEAQAPHFYLTRVFEGTAAFRGRPASTFIAIANPNEEPIELLLVLHRSAPEPAVNLPALEETRQLPARGFLWESISQIFGPGLEVSEGYLEVIVQNGRGAVAFELVEVNGGKAVIGLNCSFGNSSDRLYSAQFASSGELFTQVNLINISQEPRLVRLTAILEEGQPLGEPVERVLDPGEQWNAEARQLFPAGLGEALQEEASFVASLQVEVDGSGVIGDVIFGDPVRLEFAASLPLQALPFLRAVFSHMANLPSFFTGLAFYNPGTERANLTISVFAADGRLTGSTVRSLEPGQRISRLVPELLPSTQGQAGGYAVVVATRPVIGQLLFGAVGPEGIRLLSSVPPTVTNW